MYENISNSIDNIKIENPQQVAEIETNFDSYWRERKVSDYSDGPVQIPIDFYHPRGHVEPEDVNRQHDINRQQDISSPPPLPPSPPPPSPPPRYNPWLEPNLPEEMDLLLQRLHLEWMLHREHNHRDWEIEMRW
ncbi:unnamed protein product [Heligmosomoides polygyrus]|uniref:Uncharacterized protein n=1 Tax=Heligmosomoides polygyrus TaxID=6339 RepID=A0A3P8BHB7_HELPZ|nr:unnamed protein product [Heligmosomoides polygyrus]